MTDAYGTPTTKNEKHTPGPWKAISSPSGRNYERHGTSHEVVGDGRVGTHVARVGPLGAESELVAMANARLIAAAPDLLAALRAIASEGAGHAMCDCPAGAVAAAIARAAIAKAEGGAR